MRFYLALTVVLILQAFLQNAKAESSEDKQLNAFFEEEWEYGLKQNPIFATLLGDLRYNDQLPDASIDALKKDQAHEMEVLKKLEAIDRSRLSESNQLNYDLYLLNTKQDIEGHRFPDYVMMITQMGGIQQQVPDSVSELPFKNVKHYEDYIARLKSSL